MPLSASSSAVVSIHASAWEATYAADPHLAVRSSFNPRLRVGGDLFPLTVASVALVFQSTPPRGRRRESRRSCDPWYRRFNPRLRVGGDMEAENDA